MRTFTTPTLTFRSDGDLTDAEIILTFQQGRFQLNKKPDSVWKEGLYTKMQVTLAQGDTANVDPTKSLYVMANFIWANGARASSDVYRLDLKGNFLDREISLGVHKKGAGIPSDGTIYLQLDSEVVNASVVQSNTTEYWDKQAGLVSEAGHIYIYTDRVDEKSVIDGKSSPSFKIGDGKSYLIDLPFFSQEREGVFCHTEKEWEEFSKVQSTAGSIYIYSDHTVVSDTVIPGIKIGDGGSYIGDLPFIFEAHGKKLQEVQDKVENLEAEYKRQQAQIENHMADTEHHITQEEREYWNNKVTAKIQGSRLVLTADNLNS